ncbi:MAG: NAD(P)/FAD-dependent oxidoreductase [Alphaproteobacteria bacterium]
MKEQKIHVIGGGLVGSLAAIYLAQKGFAIDLYERRADMRRVDIPAGRSINLAVTARGLKALDEVGLKNRVLDLAIPMKGRMVHAQDGTTSFSPYGQKDDEVINSVSRGELNKLLLEKADSYDNVNMHFHHRCMSYDSAKSVFTFRDETAGQEKTVPASVTIATDGAWSDVRKSMLENTRNFNYSQHFLDHGYKELSIPAAKDGGFRLEKNALHIWPRKSYMLIALPNLDSSFTCTLFLPYDGAESFTSLRTPKDVLDFFSRSFPDALALMPTLAEDFFGNPTGSMVTVKCSPWHTDFKVMLLGDAAHAIVPFFGQGMNCGFEDCSALGQLVGQNPDWGAIFRTLEAQRKPNSDAIADMAVGNFIEMRDTVADPKFQLKKQIGFELERRYPERFIPHYAMVVFRPDISYAEARNRSAAQDRILEELCAGIISLDHVDWNKAAKLMNG